MNNDTLRTHDHHREKHRQLETILALSWTKEDHLNAILGDLGAPWDSQCRLGGVLERLMSDSEPSRERHGSALECPRGVVGASWRHLRRLGGVLEASWRGHGGEDREMARKSQVKARKCPFYLDSVTSTLNPTRKTRRESEKI